MLEMNWLAEFQFMAPSRATQIVLRLFWLAQTGRPKVLVTATLALASQVTFATGSYTVCPPGLTSRPWPVAGGVPGILPGIMGSTYKKLGSVLLPTNPEANERVS